MTPEEIKFAWTAAGGFGVGAVVAFAVAFLILRFYLPGYLGEKGKNLATKEDISEITKIVETVKHQNSELLEDRKAHNQLRFAALDKRLVAHQQAFTHWSTLQSVATNGHTMSVEKLTEISQELQQWWYENAIYLESDVRVRFDNVLITAMRLPPELETMYQPATPESARRAIESAQEEVRKLGSAIIDAVQLPALTGESRQYAAMNVTIPPLRGQASGN